ncbi:MAG: sugar phosphate isomerase/epimerase [Lentisphaeria bacterium]|nr:sugar phosphate isomerase/epimerase [Lentisphaeria bacterium]
MASGMTRRSFLASSVALGAGTVLSRGEDGVSFSTRLRKALIRGLPDEKTLLALKEAGFEGMECSAWSAAPAAAEAARRVADALGMRIHSVLRGWCNVNGPDADQVAADLDSVRQALRTARILGADALLLVPCKIGGGPQPWEFAYAFDPATCLVTRVVEGDNSRFEAYIAEHNRATETSRRALEALAPAAEAEGVVIAVENVWNNLWVKPDLFAAFVRSLGSPWIRSYLDLGNHVKYAPTPEWIAALGSTIARCHVKDFALNPDGHGGKFVDIRDGSNDWPAIRAALDRIGYNGWMTIEGSGGLSLQEQSLRLDRIIAGK